MIDIASYKNNGDSFVKFQSDLLNCLGDSVFTSSEVGLCFHLIKCIKHEFNHKPGIHADDVKKACEDIKQQFVTKFGIWEENIKNNKEPTDYQLFLLNLLDFETMPAYELTKLERSVKEDLEKRSNTIKFYDQTKYIKEYKSEGVTPRNQEEKTLHAFYIRNIEEQQTILNHLLYNVKSRAIIKAKSSILYSAHFFDPFFDRPYLTAYPSGEKFFNHEKIDLVGHRLLTVLVKDGRGLKEIYSTNKAEFYKKLVVYCPFDNVISDINYFLSILNPLSATRKELFIELIELFKTEKFYGFYSLALSQVEGLFSEMLAKINPKLLKPSLPDKVRALRPSHKNSDSHFDYYEYHIPTQRNKFMHSGLDDDIRLKSYDLLFDLKDILSIYVSLDSPIIKLTQIIKRRDNDKYFNEEGFNEYFKLLEASKKHADLYKIEGDIKEFEKDFLSGYLDLESLVSELEEFVPKALGDLLVIIKLFTKFNNGSELNLDFWTEHSIKTKTTTLVAEIKGVYEANQEAFLRLENYKYFLDKSVLYLPNMTELARTKIKVLRDRYKSDLNKIKLINQEMEKAGYGIK